MYAAKEGGRGHVLFEPQLDRYSPRRLSLAGALRQAIADGEIVLFFQPKAELTTGKIVGVEALARWQHPRLGLDRPDRVRTDRRADRPDRPADLARARTRRCARCASGPSRARS